MGQIGSFLERLKSRPNGERLEILENLRASSPEPGYQRWMREKYEIMNRDELMALPELIEIGSHTRTHPMLPLLDDEAARDEIEGSREILSEMLGKPVTSFCYPNGRMSPRDRSIVKRTYRVAVTVNEGFARRGDPLHVINRIPAADNMTDHVLRLLRATA